MSKDTKVIADSLFTAFKAHEPIDFVSNTYNITEADAYHTQSLLIEQLQTVDNSNIAGYRVNMTNDATQILANTNEPAYGTILSSKIVQSNESISLSSLFNPLIEPEIMFIVTDDIPMDADDATILSCVDIAPGLGIADARYKNWFPNFTLSDFISDNSATGLVVVGEIVPASTISALANVEMTLTHNSIEVAEGSAEIVLGNPFQSLTWLVSKLQQHNKQLTKGQLVASGTFIRALPITHGTYHATFTAIGEISVTFVD